MRWIAGVLVALFALVACADAPAGPASGGSGTPEPSPTLPVVDTLRVDIIEVGIREVLGDATYPTLWVAETLCSTDEDGDGERPPCEELTDAESEILRERLTDLGRTITFYGDGDAVPGPEDGTRYQLVFTGPPVLQDDGTYWIEAGEACGGLCGHGGTYVVERRGDRWVSTGPAPGTFQWIS